MSDEIPNRLPDLVAERRDRCVVLLAESRLQRRALVAKVTDLLSDLHQNRKSLLNYAAGLGDAERLESARVVQVLDGQLNATIHDYRMAHREDSGVWNQITEEVDWHEAKHELPLDCRVVLVGFADGAVEAAYIENDLWRPIQTICPFDEDPTHWAELPKVPRLEVGA